MSSSSTTTNGNIGAIDWRCYTALHYAARDGDVKEVERLLAFGADVDGRNKLWRETPLHLASERGHVQVAQALLTHGADTEARDVLGRTSLAEAAQRHSAKVVGLLLFRGANVHATDHDGFTPLHFSANYGFRLVAERLIAFGADLECFNSHGWTPLMLAVSWGHIEAVRLLLELNADTTKRSRRDWTVSQTEHDEIKKLLVAHLTKTDFEREQTRIDTMNRLRYDMSIQLMRHAQPDIIDICLALAPFQLPAYVLLWIMDWLPNFDRLSHYKKIHLIQSVVKSIRQIKVS